MPLRSKLLAVPSLKEKYLRCVRAIAEQSLTWDELGPIVTIPGLHANFKLSSKGETVYLVDSDHRGNVVIDYVKFENQTNDVAFGRLPSKADKWQALVPTPAAANRAGG